MNAEYQRLEAEASEVSRRMAELSAGAAVRSSADLVRLESEMSELGRKLASLQIGMALIRSVDSPEFRQCEREFVEALPKTFHSQGTRTKTVVLPGGVTVELEVRYYHRKKHPTAFDKGRRGLFPALLLLGIESRFTPGVRMRMAKAAALLGSYEEAATMLAGEGIRVCVNVLRRVTAGMGRMLRKLTQQGALTVSGTVAGRRIVVTMDGGRVRLRERRKGKTKKGRKRFSPKWREPRLFLIYAVDEEGRQADDFLPIIDGSLGTCDEFFAILRACLQGLGLTEAARVLFVADGATWIWRRIPRLIKALGLKDVQVQQLIDFWHAVEYLGKLADSERLTGSVKSRWLKTQKKRLLRGEIGGVVDELKTLVGPRPTKCQRTWLNYFITNGLTHRRMDYSLSRGKNMPIGSGAIESAVRRVINLRVKSNATYWLRENAETMIRLRGWIKAGREEELFRQTTCITPQLAL
jgi:hypothetical protein